MDSHHGSVRSGELHAPKQSIHLIFVFLLCIYFSNPLHCVVAVLGTRRVRGRGAAMRCTSRQSAAAVCCAGCGCLRCCSGCQDNAALLLSTAVHW